MFYYSKCQWTALLEINRDEIYIVHLSLQLGNHWYLYIYYPNIHFRYVGTLSDFLDRCTSL